ncbi:hypothetical protein TNCV_679601 [Trichonephila clavipes]|nr:hypothetical protein TNCV_679601 [Trichonephila clavipes]
MWQRVEASWSASPQEHIQSHFESMPRRVAAVISNNGCYSGYRFCRNHTLQNSINLIISYLVNMLSKNKFCCAISCLSWCCIYVGQQCKYMTEVGSSNTSLVNCSDFDKTATLSTFWKSEYLVP